MKVKLKIKVIGDESFFLETVGIKNDNTIKYLEKDLKVLIKIYDNSIIIERSNNDYQIIINLEEKKDTISTYKFIGGNKNFELKTKTSLLLIDDKEICAKYNLEGNDFEFILEVIE